jgi:hypothetical protein
MGTIGTNLKYKKVQKYIDYALASLDYAKKCIKIDNKNPFKKNIDDLVRELYIFAKQVADRNKKNTKLISIINQINEHLSVISKTDDNENIASIEALHQTTLTLAKQISQYYDKEKRK